ncbi:MAG: PAS domain S-box protein [Thermodesulfobacteria bacterium]|nr:PAS domain S-box protein [Thermodesulfobacteriota bacterium]
MFDQDIFENYTWINVLDAVPSLVTIHDCFHRFLFINKAAKKAFPRAELGATCYEVVHETEEPPPFCPLVETFQDKRRHSRVFFHEKLQKQFMVTTSPIFDKCGEVVAAIHIAHDVTKVKEIEHRYFQQKTISDFIFEKSPLGILVTSKRVILHVNEAFEKITGYKKDELIGRSTRIFYKDQESFEEFGRRAQNILKVKKVFTWEEELIRKDGRKVPVRASCRMIGAPEYGDEDMLIWVVEDLSTQKEIEKARQKLKERGQQLQRLKALGILASGIAHDFNNILTPIMGYTELALYRAQDEQLKAHLEVIATAAKKAKDLIENLLKFSKGEKGSTVLFDISEKVLENIKLLKGTLPSSVIIRQKVSPIPKPVKGDPTQIDEIIMNLSINALHAMDEAGVLEIGCCMERLDESFLEAWPEFQPGEYAHLWVADTGCGMDEETLSKIFEPYFTTKDSGKGTGLGLAMVFNAVKTNGGFITVESKKGEGSTFHIYFRLHDENLEQCHVEATPGRFSNLSDAKILLVDDEESVLTLASEFLELSGAKVKGLNRADDALSLIKNEGYRPDVLVTDLTMPKMTGDELILQCRKIIKGLPAVIISGFGHEISRELDDVPIVKKPFRMEDLVRTIKMVLNKEDKA